MLNPQHWKEGLNRTTPYALLKWLWDLNSVIAHVGIASFFSRVDKIPSSVYEAYRQACATAEEKQPEGKALSHLLASRSGPQSDFFLGRVQYACDLV